jgi:NAD(P)-dependent dehydrogenase (short-subunit alcohol dehydrogenase family)
VNLTGSFNLIRFVAAAMRENPPLEDGQRGVVVNCASIAGWEGTPGLAAYSSAKAGLQGLTLSAARELSRFGIRVNCIVPGVFATPALVALQQRLPDIPVVAAMFPHRVGRPDEFATLVGHLVENDYLNATLIRIDGGTFIGSEVV